MGELKAFLKYDRVEVPRRPIEQRIKDFRELELFLSPDDITSQAARCMDCGIPFCLGAGCPLENRIPEFNEAVYKGNWKQACDNLHSTNNFPEFTGLVCPAPCEAACTLAVNDKPVLIRHIELQIVERGFKEGWIKPILPKERTLKKIAVVGSGPAGLAAAQQLARYGHELVVFEKDERPGGLLRYGIPDFKLEKQIIDRRINQLMAEGVEFQTTVEAGVDISAGYLKKMFDCVCLATGAGRPRDINVQGRGYENIHFAWDFLALQNKIISGERIDSAGIIDAGGKDVVVIGGGDTGSDCVGTARRQGAKSICQLEILPKPPEDRPPDTLWPDWPRIMRTSSSHEEGCERMWSVTTKKFKGVETRVAGLGCCKVEWIQKNGNWQINEIPGTDFELKADLVLLAMGFLHLKHEGLVNDLALDLDDQGNIKINNFQTTEPWVFAAGDAVRGASLVVHAIKTGRDAALAIDKWLTEHA